MNTRQCSMHLHGSLLGVSKAYLTSFLSSGVLALSLPNTDSSTPFQSPRIMRTAADQSTGLEALTQLGYHVMLMSESGQTGWLPPRPADGSCSLVTPALRAWPSERRPGQTSPENLKQPQLLMIVLQPHL